MILTHSIYIIYMRRIGERCNFSLVACNSLQIQSLLASRCKFTRYSLQKLLVTCCRSCSLQKLTRYSLQILLVTRCRSCSLQNITRYSFQTLLVIRCRSCSLQKITRYSLQKLLVAKNYSLLNYSIKNYSISHETKATREWNLVS